MDEDQDEDQDAQDEDVEMEAPGLNPQEMQTQGGTQEPGLAEPGAAAQFERKAAKVSAAYDLTSVLRMAHKLPSTSSAYPLTPDVRQALGAHVVGASPVLLPGVVGQLPPDSQVHQRKAGQVDKMLDKCDAAGHVMDDPRVADIEPRVFSCQWCGAVDHSQGLCPLWQLCDTRGVADQLHRGLPLEEDQVGVVGHMVSNLKLHGMAANVGARRGRFGSEYGRTLGPETHCAVELFYRQRHLLRAEDSQKRPLANPPPPPPPSWMDAVDPALLDIMSALRQALPHTQGMDTLPDTALRRGAALPKVFDPSPEMVLAMSLLAQEIAAADAAEGGVPGVAEVVGLAPPPRAGAGASGGR